MTAAGRQLASAAALIPPAAERAAAAARPRRGRLAEHVVVAHLLHGCMGCLASAISTTGYQAKQRWGWEFRDGRAADPRWLYESAVAAAQAVQDGANTTCPIRAATGLEPRRAHDGVAAASALWRVLQAYGEMLRGVGRAGLSGQAQIPEYAAIFTALQTACQPLATAAKRAAPRLRAAEVQFESVWAEGYGGDMPACYRSAARDIDRGGRALAPVCLRADQDAVWWRSAARPRPARSRR